MKVPLVYIRPIELTKDGAVKLASPKTAQLWSAYRTGLDGVSEWLADFMYEDQAKLFMQVLNLAKL